MTNGEEFTGKGNLSRRDFLKLSGAGAVGFILTEMGVRPVSAKESEYKLVHGVEVYGLDKKINNIEDAKNLTLGFDLDFERKLSWGMKQKSVWEQRESILPKDKRFVEFVVKESVYKSFESRRLETGVNYVEWVKLHVDLLNRVLKNAKPPVLLGIELSRIVVVGDSFQDNPVPYSKDIDAMWFDDNDRRINQTSGAIGQDSFWSVKHDGEGRLVAQNPAGADYGRQIVLPKTSDSFETVRDGIWLDYGLIHELGHLLLNIPDEYVFSFEGVNSLFGNFRFNTGSFMEPNMSSYLSLLLDRNIKTGIRGYYTDPRSIGRAPGLLSKFSFYGEVPSNITLSVSTPGVEIANAYKSQFLFPDYYDKKDNDGKKISCKKMVPVEGVERLDNSASLSKKTFDPQTIEGEGLFPVLFRFDFKYNGVNNELYIPIGIFNMTKYSGVSDAKYIIEFTNVLPPKEMKSQTLNLIDQSDLDSFLKNNSVYAKMKVDGTSSWCVWSFQY